MDQPRLHTHRLLLTPPRLSDAPRVMELASDPVIAEFTLSVPNPYTEADLIRWLHAIQSGWSDQTSFVFAIRDPASGAFLGAVGLHLHASYGHGELGYWMGQPYRRQGYVREAVGAVIDYGFNHTGIDRIQAIHRVDNTPSARILLANGLVREARLEQYMVKDGQAWDVIQYRLLRREWETTLENS